MLRYILIAMFGLFSVAMVGCDDNEAELETPGGDVKVDVD